MFSPRKYQKSCCLSFLLLVTWIGIYFSLSIALSGDDFPKPYSPQCTERENIFEFTVNPVVKSLGNDKYEISFAVKGNCDVTVAIVDEKGAIVRHLASGVLGPNAPEPFQKNTLKQVIYWDGKDDLGIYHKEPEKLKVHVMLGLKPVFERLLGPTDPRSLPGQVLGFAVDNNGVYVFSKSSRIVYCRQFDHNGNYVKSLVPPPSDLPESKLGGRTFIEYEPGKRAHHGPYLMEDLGFNGNCVPGLDDDKITSLQSVVARKRIYYCNGGGSFHIKKPSRVHYFYTDGSTDVNGCAGRTFIKFICRHEQQRFAVSPDEKWIYMVGMTDRGDQNAPVVMRFSVDGDEPAEVFLGKANIKGNNVSFAPGSDNESFNNPTGIDCDRSGRIYVADHNNNRLQVYSPEGKFLKTIRIEGIAGVQVHKETGAIYVLHTTEIEGRTVGRISKLKSFDDPREELHLDHVHASVFIVDSWASEPRIWLNGFVRQFSPYERVPVPDNVVVLRETGGTLKKILDFNELLTSNKLDYLKWSGSVFDHVNCDPVREQVYFRAFREDPWVFDLQTGEMLYRVKMRGPVNDIAFDKKGYMHLHFDPGFYMPGVARVDPSRPATFKDHLGREHKGFVIFPEVPYDYGVELQKPQHWGWSGGIPVKDQPGAKYFQDGFGVNMRGELAVESNIYYIPKMEEEGFESAFIGPKVRVQRGGTWFHDKDPYLEFIKGIQEKLKLGEEVYYIKRKPGIPLTGGTVWTYEATGELREECAVIATKLVVGLHIDEDGYLYFANDRARLINGKPFLYQRGGNFGTAKPIYPHNTTPVTYTVMKTKPKNVRWLLRRAPVPLDEMPNRPTDLVPFGPFGEVYMGDAEAWVEGALWFYAGLTPAVPEGCTCPATRFHLDWFKRSYIPEGYRRSIAILDTNGNLIMRFGRYGTYDDALRCKKGSDDIPLTLPRFISGTDNFLCFDDWGERLVQLRLSYHTKVAVNIERKD